MTLEKNWRSNRLWLPVPALIIISALIFTLTAANASAIGVSTPYIEKNTIQIPEKHSTQLQITLQNSEEKEYSVRLDYSSDSDMASVIDYKGVYVLPAKSIDTKVTFNITAPETAKVGDSYDFKFSVYPFQAQAGNVIPFTAGIGRNFKVAITRDPDKFYLGYYLAETGRLWGIVILVLAGYIAYGIYKKRKEKGRKPF